VGQIRFACAIKKSSPATVLKSGKATQQSGKATQRLILPRFAIAPANELAFGAKIPAHRSADPLGFSLYLRHALY